MCTRIDKIFELRKLDTVQVVIVKFCAWDLMFHKDKRGKAGTRTGGYRQTGQESTLASTTLRSVALTS
jgi:hypothetical protein